MLPFPTYGYHWNGWTQISLLPRCWRQGSRAVVLWICFWYLIKQKHRDIRDNKWLSMLLCFFYFLLWHLLRNSWQIQRSKWGKIISFLDVLSQSMSLILARYMLRRQSGNKPTFATEYKMRKQLCFPLKEAKFFLRTRKNYLFVHENSNVLYQEQTTVRHKSNFNKE